MSKQLTVLVCVLLLGVGVAVDTNQDGKTIVLDLKSTPDGQLFYVQLQVGEVGKQQTFNMLVATTYHLTWIPSRELRPTRGFEDANGLLNTSAYFGSNNGIAGGYSYFHPHLDWVQVGSEIIEKQQIAVHSTRGRTYFKENESIFDGMLGLSIRKATPDESGYLFENLHHLSYIDKLMFSLYINNSVAAYDDDDNNPKGALVLGGVDHNYFTGDINYVKLYEDPMGALFSRINKSLIVTSIQLDWSRVGRDTRSPLELPPMHRSGKIDLYSPPARLRLDSTTKLFVGDKLILDKIHLNFIGAKSVGDTGVYVFYDCQMDNKPDIVFTLDEMDIVLTPDDYLISGQIDGSPSCFSALKPYQSRGSGIDYPIWVFGTRFLRKYYTVFDYDNDVVGFATPE